MSRSGVMDLRAETRTRSTRGAAGFAVRTLRRFVDADGTTHVRALACESILIVLSGFIGVIGLASLLHAEWFRGVVVELGRGIAPGPAGRLVGEAAARGAHAASSAAAFGLAAAFATGTLAMAQVERSANRIAGLAEDSRSRSSSPHSAASADRPPRAILPGSLVAVVLWAEFTGLLSLYFSIQTGSAYGPLLSIVAY